MSMNQLPHEILVQLLSYIDCKTQVFSCRLVCKRWQYIVENESLRNRAVATDLIPKSVPKLGWYMYYALEIGVFGKNLLINPYGNDQLEHWNIIRNGGDGFSVENPVATNFPDDILAQNKLSRTETACFMTSFAPCIKEQIVKLKDHSITGRFMDEVRPPISVAEWYGLASPACGIKYELTAELLDESKEVITSETFTKELRAHGRYQWHQAKLHFQGYEPGVRFICFRHMGTDTQYWEGRYGAKMTLGEVHLHCPALPIIL